MLQINIGYYLGQSNLSVSQLTIRKLARIPKPFFICYRIHLHTGRLLFERRPLNKDKEGIEGENEKSRIEKLLENVREKERASRARR
ncbi:hypothetical protein IPA_06575 [Ignicoccus pacificus DSM 13166]|uniref:Uncharacterized protein n=1 Tax=Ignicoccus pacificus DSM 13166 TaxID=940294 RepID=A0A977KBJ3_9CREN|nr:hypothetical protein IPA_06575 [Ignicoccus pacificus DSM 13166]